MNDSHASSQYVDGQKINNKNIAGKNVSEPGQSNVKTEQTAITSRPGILKPPTMENSKQDTMSQKNVTFLDSRGLPPTEEDPKPPICFPFDQPAANYQELQRKLERNFVGLATLHFQGPRQFCGTVKVKNCAFEKKVFLRITFNSWESSSDIQCLYVDNGLSLRSMYDIFRFETVIPSS